MLTLFSSEADQAYSKLWARSDLVTSYHAHAAVYRCSFKRRSWPCTTDFHECHQNTWNGIHEGQGSAQGRANLWKCAYSNVFGIQPMYRHARPIVAEVWTSLAASIEIRSSKKSSRYVHILRSNHDYLAEIHQLNWLCAYASTIFRNILVPKASGA